MSSQHPGNRHPDREHPDRGELADEIAGVAGPTVAEHLAGCRDCSARLAALRTASLSVSEYLRTDPEPELPLAIAARFAQAIAAESAARPVVPTRTRLPRQTGLRNIPAAGARAGGPVTPGSVVCWSPQPPWWWSVGAAPWWPT